MLVLKMNINVSDDTFAICDKHDAIILKGMFLLCPSHIDERRPQNGGVSVPLTSDSCVCKLPFFYPEMQ